MQDPTEDPKHIRPKEQCTTNKISTANRSCIIPLLDLESWQPRIQPLRKTTPPHPTPRIFLYAILNIAHLGLFFSFKSWLNSRTVTFGLQKDL